MWRVMGVVFTAVMLAGCSSTSSNGDTWSSRRLEQRAATAQGRPELQVRNGGLPASPVTVTRLAGVERVATQMSFKRYYTVVGCLDQGGAEVGLAHFYLYNGPQTVARSGPSDLRISEVDPHVAEATWRYEMHGGPSGRIRVIVDGSTGLLSIADQTYNLRAGNFFRLILLPEGYLQINQMPVIDVAPTDPVAVEALFDQYTAWLRLWNM